MKFSNFDEINVGDIISIPDDDYKICTIMAGKVVEKKNKTRQLTIARYCNSLRWVWSEHDFNSWHLVKLTKLDVLLWLGNKYIDK